MNVLKKLDDLKGSKPYHGFAKLQLGSHCIEAFRVVKNKFCKKGEGCKKSIFVELSDQVLFLPQYFWQKLTETDVEELNASEDEIHIFIFRRSAAGIEE